MEASQAQQQSPADEATLAALVVLLLSGMPEPELTPIAAEVLGIPVAAVGSVLELLAPNIEPDLGQMPASASGWVARTAFPRHAAYVVNAAKRLASDPSSITAERRYLSQHLGAERGRREAAAKVDEQAAIHGLTLGWYSRRDDHPTVGCRAMHGHNFSVLDPPIVEGRPAYPGTVHPFCRCKPGAPHRVGVREPAGVLVGA
jgi:hypothetical protein